MAVGLVVVGAECMPGNHWRRDYPGNIPTTHKHIASKRSEWCAQMASVRSLWHLKESSLRKGDGGSKSALERLKFAQLIGHPLGEH